MVATLNRVRNTCRVTEGHNFDAAPSFLPTRRTKPDCTRFHESEVRAVVQLQVYMLLLYHSFFWFKFVRVCRLRWLPVDITSPASFSSSINKNNLE